MSFIIESCSYKVSFSLLRWIDSFNILICSWDLALFLWLRSTALLFTLIVLDVAEAATAAEASVAKLEDGLATGGLLNDAANKGVDDNEMVVETE